jgi:uncharacterized protein YyaL (SSP411 family)
VVGIRDRLFAVRERRVRPGRDEKVLAAWNGLMLRSFALAARVTGREDYREAALKNATFLLDKLKENGRLHRSYKDGRARFNGYLEDYAMVADGLVALYEATFETRWLIEADSLCDAVSELFWDEEKRAFYDTPADHEELVTRPRDVYDNAAPSGTSVVTEVLLKLALLLDRNDYRQRAEDILEELSGGMEKVPGAFGRLLCALDFATSEPREVAIVGTRARLTRGRSWRRSTSGIYRTRWSRAATPRRGGGRPDLAPRRAPDQGRPRHRLRLRAIRLQGPDHRAGGTGAATGRVASKPEPPAHLGPFRASAALPVLEISSRWVLGG